MRIKMVRLYLNMIFRVLESELTSFCFSKGIVFCVEFKVGESKILEADIDQVLDYALDLKIFHKFSQDNLIVPILVATNYSNSSTDIRMSVYDDRGLIRS